MLTQRQRSLKDPARHTPEARCITCRRPCQHSRLRFTVWGQPARISKRLESALKKGGFEIVGRENLATLGQEALGVETAPLDLLYIKNPVLLLQALLMGGEPSLFFPFIAILRPSIVFTEICIMSVSSLDKAPETGLGEQLIAQAWEKLFQAIAPLRVPA